MTIHEPRWALLAVCLLIIMLLANRGILADWVRLLEGVRRLVGPAGIFGFAIGWMILGTAFVREERDG